MRQSLHVIACFGCFFLGCQPLDRSLKLAHGLGVEHPIHRSMEFLAERVAEKSNGSFTLEIYPSQQLGTERECLELLQIGSLGMTKVSSSVLENFAPTLQVLGLPYLFRDRSHAYATFDGAVGRELLLAVEPVRLRGLAFLDAGQRSFYTIDRPVRTPDDLENLKIRVQESPVAMQMVDRLGGAPTPISYGELYTALQQGIVDGAENNPPSFYTSRHYEIAKYYSLNEHTAVPDVLLIGTAAWERLTEREQTWLTEAVAEATTYQRELWRAAETEALAAVEAAGVEIIRPDKSSFRERTAALLDEFAAAPELREVIGRIQAVE